MIFIKEEYDTLVFDPLLSSWMFPPKNEICTYYNKHPQGRTRILKVSGGEANTITGQKEIGHTGRSGQKKNDSPTYPVKLSNAISYDIVQSSVLPISVSTTFRFLSTEAE